MRADYKRKRDRYGIIADILATCRESTSTVQLLRRANTCHVQLKLIAPELISRGLLEREGTSYRTTKQGFEWLRLYRQLQNSRSGAKPPAERRINIAGNFSEALKTVRGKRGIQKLVENKVAETLVKFNDEVESSGLKDLPRAEPFGGGNPKNKRGARDCQTKSLGSKTGSR